MKRLALFALTLCLARVALAFGIAMEGGYVVSWPSSVLDYELDQDATSDITDGSDLDAIDNAIYSWNAITCSNVQFTLSRYTASTETVLTSGWLPGALNSSSPTSLPLRTS